MLLGSSGGEQFLVVLPEEVRAIADEFFVAARRRYERLSRRHLDIIGPSLKISAIGRWSASASTMSCCGSKERPWRAGDPTVIAGPLARSGLFRATRRTASACELGRMESRFSRETQRLARANTPGAVGHIAGCDSAGTSYRSHRRCHDSVAEPAILGRRAEGGAVWGVLRGDVDNFGIRIRRLQTIEEHVQLSVHVQAVFRGRTGSAVLASRILAQSDAAACRRRRFRRLRRLGCVDRIRARIAASFPAISARRI